MVNSEWRKVLLKDIASISLSGVNKLILPEETSVRLCNYLDVYRNWQLRSSYEFALGSATASEIARFRLQKGDVVITKDSETPDDIGIPAVVVDDLENVICGYHLALIRPTEGVNSAFLGYHLLSDTAKRHFLMTATGVTRFGLGVRAIASMPVLLAPPDEQAPIACILDAVDTSIALTREALERERIFRETLLHQLLRFGLRREKQKKSGAGLIPASWNCELLGDHLESGPTNGVYRPESDYGTQGTRIVRIDSFADGEIHDIKALRRVKVEPVIEQRYQLRESDLLINRVNSLSHIGKAAIVPVLDEPTIFESNMMALRCGKALAPEFLILVLCSDIARRHWLSRAKPAVNQASINQRDVRVLPVPLPERDEQIEIANIISAAANHARYINDVIVAQTELKKSLMHDLLTGKVRVHQLTLENESGA